MSQEVWIYFESDGDQLAPITRELIAKGQELAAALGARAAALMIGADADALVAHARDDGLAKAYRGAGPRREHYTADGCVAGPSC